MTNLTLSSVLFDLQSADSARTLVSVSSLTRSHYSKVAFYLSHGAFKNLKIGRQIGGVHECSGFYYVYSSLQSILPSNH